MILRYRVLITIAICLFWLIKHFLMPVPIKVSRGVRQFFSLYNQEDYKTIYKDFSSSRIRSSEDYIDFRADMREARQRLGKVSSWKKIFFLDDDEYKKYRFYSVAYKTKNDAGQAVYRFVFVERKGKLFLDGIAISFSGKFIIAVGNLYRFPDMLILNFDKKGKWKDSLDMKGVMQIKRRKYFEAIQLASDGKFDEAEQLFMRYGYTSGHMSLNMKLKIELIKAAKQGNTQAQASKILFKAYKAYEKDNDIESAISLCKQAIGVFPDFAMGYFVLSSILLDKDSGVQEDAMQYIKKGLILSPYSRYGYMLIAAYFSSKV